MDGERETRRADLRPEGVRVGGIAPVRAITELAEPGYAFPGVAGAPAATIAGSGVT